MAVSIRAHLAAINLLLDPLRQPPTNLTIVDGALDDEGKPALVDAPPATPYVVLRTDMMPVSSDRLAQYSSVLNGRLYVTHVGGTLDELHWAIEKVRGVLLDATPVVAGRSVAPLALTDSLPVQDDRTVRPMVFYGVDLYRIFST